MTPIQIELKGYYQAVGKKTQHKSRYITLGEYYTYTDKNNIKRTCIVTAINEETISIAIYWSNYSNNNTDIVPIEVKEIELTKY